MRSDPRRIFVARIVLLRDVNEFLRQSPGRHAFGAPIQHEVVAVRKGARLEVPRDSRVGGRVVNAHVREVVAESRLVGRS